MIPSLWEPNPVKVLELKGLVRRLDSLIEMKQHENNRQDVADSMAKDAMERHVRPLDRRLPALYESIRQHFDDS